MLTNDSQFVNITFESPAIPKSNKRVQPIVKQLPTSIVRPISSYYTDIRWDDGFQNWNLIRFSTPMDGSCLFHAICNSFFVPYHTEKLDGQHISRSEIVYALRKRLSEKLAEPISNYPTYYDSLNGGNTRSFSEVIPEFTLEYMQRQLDSKSMIGYGYMEFIGNSLDKDIYILEACRHDIYITDELPFCIKGNRNSIVLYYINGHYELVGIHKDNETFDTYFSPNHSFVRFLYNRVLKYM